MQKLNKTQRHILEAGGTEPPGSSPLLREDRDGVYKCARCGTILFNSNTKYDSGSGWPSFTKAENNSVLLQPDLSHGMERTEVKCYKCNGHLGHMFNDGPTGERYCVNGAVLDFEQTV
jgi:peptide-methionine (R)-S-oxide reductase